MTGGWVVRVRSRRRAWFVVALTSAAVALVVVQTALAVSTRNYWYQSNMPPGDWSDGISHNHTYNEMYWGPGANYHGEIWEDVAGAMHYYHSFNGNFGASDPGTYFGFPICGNLTSSTHFVHHCLAQW
jgi:hypothetical protein